MLLLAPGQPAASANLGVHDIRQITCVRQLENMPKLMDEANKCILPVAEEPAPRRDGPFDFRSQNNAPVIGLVATAKSDTSRVGLISHLTRAPPENLDVGLLGGRLGRWRNPFAKLHQIGEHIIPHPGGLTQHRSQVFVESSISKSVRHGVGVCY